MYFPLILAHEREGEGEIERGRERERERNEQQPASSVSASSFEKCFFHAPVVERRWHCAHKCDWQAGWITQTNQERDAVIGQKWARSGLKSKLAHTQAGAVDQNRYSHSAFH